jgi:hypothetical protein
MTFQTLHVTNNGAGTGEDDEATGTGGATNVTSLPTASRASGLPRFEGQDVASTRLRMTSVSSLDLEDDKPFRIDDMVKLFVEGRVTRVDHVVDEKSGELRRVHTIRVELAQEVSWNFDDAPLRR